MKTKEEVFAHLKSVGYLQSEISKIMGFLIGNGTKSAKELVHYRRGNRTFDDFLSWYQTEPKCDNNYAENADDCPICSMLKVLFTAMDIATERNDLEILSYLDELMNLMLDTFIEDTTTCDE